MRILLLPLLCMTLTSAFVAAQGTPVPTATVDSTGAMEMDGPVDRRNQPSMIEFGISPYYSFVAGDVTAKGGYGAGVHLRKSLDHLFSVRLDALYARSKGDNEVDRINTGNRRHDTDWFSGTAYGVVTLNNFKYKGDIRNWNVLLMAGAGFNYFSTEYQCSGEEGLRNCPSDPLPWSDNDRNPEVPFEFQTHAAFGLALNRRLSERINIGIEYQALVPLGNRADLVDGYDPLNSTSDFRDVQNVAGISININLGNTNTRSEPRYWVNAFTPLKDDISTLNSRVDEATMDTDGDGIVNSVDQENDTPAGVPVDSRGRTLDSDKDGVPDFRDLEPFFPPRQGEVVDADGVVTKRNDAPLTQNEIQTLIDTSIARAIAEGNMGNNTTRINSAGGAIYLPMIYFNLNSSEIKYEDYGQLASISRVLTANPEMRLIVRGYTDRTGNTTINQRLSYLRARNTIDHLVEVGGIDRTRLVLQYRGDEEAIVPLDRSRVNRRVEFLTGMGDVTEDEAPEGVMPQSDGN